MRFNGTVCVFCRRLGSYPSGANRRGFNLQISDSRKSSPPPDRARCPSQRKHTSQKSTPPLMRVELEGDPRYGRKLGKQHIPDGVENCAEQRASEGEGRPGVTPLDLIRLALLPHEANARAEVASRANPDIKELLDLFGASNDVFSQLLIGLARVRNQEFTFGGDALQGTTADNEAEIPVSQLSHATQRLIREEISSRLQLAHTIDDILTVARTASQTAYGRSVFMSLCLPLCTAIKRCGLQRGSSHKENLAAFNSISSVLLEHGSDLDFRYCVIGLRYAASTGTLPAMQAMKRYLNACHGPHLQMPDETWIDIAKRIVRFASVAELPTLPADKEGSDPCRAFESRKRNPVVWGSSDAWRSFEGWKSSRAWKQREALNLLTGWETAGVGGPNETRDVSLESFLDRQNMPVFAEYILSLGQLGASEAIWQEWLISRDRVVGARKAQDKRMAETEFGAGDTRKNANLEPVDPCAAPNNAGSPEQLLFHFLQALMAAQDYWRSWQLINEVKTHNPALLSPRIWYSLLGFYHPSYSLPSFTFHPHRRASTLTEIVSNTLQAGGGASSIHELTQTAMRYWEEWNTRLGHRSGGETKGWRGLWTLWAECAGRVVGKRDVEWVRDVERVLGVDWIATPGGGGVHVRRSDDTPGASQSEPKPGRSAMSDQKAGC